MLFYNFLFLFFLKFDLTDSLVLDLFFDEADELAQVFHSFISKVTASYRNLALFFLFCREYLRKVRSY